MFSSAWPLEISSYCVCVRACVLLMIEKTIEKIIVRKEEIIIQSIKIITYKKDVMIKISNNIKLNFTSVLILVYNTISVSSIKDICKLCQFYIYTHTHTKMKNFYDYYNLLLVFLKVM